MKQFTHSPTFARWMLLFILAPILVGAAVFVQHIKPAALAVAFSPDGRLLATSSEILERGQSAPCLTVWDLKAGRRHFEIRPKTAAYSLAFSHDNRRLATGHLDGVRIWDIETGGCVKLPLSDGQGPFLFVAFTQGSKKLLAVTLAGAMLHDLETSQTEVMKFPTGYTMRSAAISADGRSLAVAISDSRPTAQVKLYDVSDSGLTPVDWISISVGGLAFCNDGQLAMTTSKGIEIWDFRRNKILTKLFDPGAGALAFSRSNNVAAIGGFDPSYSYAAVRLWSTTGPSPLQEMFGGHGTAFRCLAFSPDGGQIAAASTDGSTSVWNTHDGHRVLVLNGNATFLWSLAALVASFLLWSITWVWFGRRLEARFWPFVDVLLVDGLVLAGLVLRQCLTLQPRDVQRLAAAFAMGVIASQGALLMFWEAFGRSRWQARLPGVVAGFAAVWCVPLAIWESTEAWQHLVCAAVYLTCLALAFHNARSRGLCLQRTKEPLAATKGAETRQFRLSDLLLWTSAAAIFCAVARFAVPHGLATTGLRLLATIGITLALTAIASCWFVLGKAVRPIRLFAWATIVAACGFVAHLAAPAFTTLSWWLWPISLHASLALSLAGSLAIVRAYGYRLHQHADALP